MSTHTLSVLVENKPGVLARIASLFSRRGFNIDSLAVGPTEHPEISRMTIMVNVEDSPLEQVTKQLNKLIEVIKIVELEPGDAVRLMARPESLRMRRAAAGGGRGGRELEGRVAERRFAGAATFYRLEAGRAEVTVQGAGGEAEVGEGVYFRPHDDALPVAFPAETG